MEIIEPILRRSKSGSNYEGGVKISNPDRKRHVVKKGKVIQSIPDPMEYEVVGPDEGFFRALFRSRKMTSQRRREAKRKLQIKELLSSTPTTPGVPKW